MEAGGGALAPSLALGKGPAGLSLGSPGRARRGDGEVGEREAPDKRLLHKGRGPGRRRGARGGGCGGAARTQRRRAGGSALTGRAGAVHARGPAAGAGEAGEAALRWPRSAAGDRVALGAGVLAPGRVAALLPRPARCGAALPRAARAPCGCARAPAPTRRAGRAGPRLPAPGWRGGAGPGTPTWPWARAATCGRARSSGPGPVAAVLLNPRLRNDPQAAGRRGSPRGGTASPLQLSQQARQTSQPCARAKWAGRR